jgi:hypothetical protein
MAAAEWDIREEGTWYKVTARGTCPACGALFEERSQRRKAAGPPETPALSVRQAADGTVELVAEGFFLPIVTHTCQG